MLKNNIFLLAILSSCFVLGASEDGRPPKKGRFSPVAWDDSYFVPETPPSQRGAARVDEDTPSGSTEIPGTPLNQEADDDLDREIPCSQRFLGDLLIDLQGDLRKGSEVIIPKMERNVTVDYSFLRAIVDDLNASRRFNGSLPGVAGINLRQSSQIQPHKLTLNYSAGTVENGALKKFFTRVLHYDPISAGFGINDKFKLTALKVKRMLALEKMDPLETGDYTPVLYPLSNGVPDDKIRVRIEIAPEE